MCQIRMVVSDLDGTLLDENHQLSGALAERIRRYIGAGGLFTLATGRNWAAVRFIAERLTVRLPVILCNGAVLADGERVYYRAGIPAPGMQGLFADAQQAGLSVLLFEHEQIYAMGNPEGIARFSAKEKLVCRPARADADFLSGLDLIKAALVGPYETSLALWEKHQESYGGAYDCVRTETDFFELVRRGENKGGAMLRLAGQLGIAPGEILAIGNHMNDSQMLAMAGVGAAVGDCSPELRPFADYLCQKPNGQGVLEALERFCPE